MKKHKLGIIVPFRNRHDQLVLFKQTITNYLNNFDMDYEIIIVEQEEGKLFNRGMLLNIGFKYAKKLKCDYVVFHDVDMLPINVDYSYSDYPIHLASNFKSSHPSFSRTVFDTYFGGVTLFPVDVFEQVNGYSNDYWGWGYEDDDLLYRCKVNKAKLNTKEVNNVGGNTAALKFNGVDAYVEFRNKLDFKSQITIFVSFCPDDIKCNHEKYDDAYTIFSIPGGNLSINYNSYARYNFQMYDNEDNVLYINSDIKTNYKTNICVTIDPTLKLIRMFQDGILIGEKTYEKELYNYTASPKCYLGCDNPRSLDEIKYYGGLITSFASFNKCLSDEEILEISKNQYFGLTEGFGNYQSHGCLVTYYDSKFIKEYKMIDLVSFTNNARIVSCEVVAYSFDEIKNVDIPYRRDCSFNLIPHEENGYVGGAWKDISIRYNQMRYFNEVYTGYRNTNQDGLSNLKFKELGNANINNQTHITVSI